MKYIWSVWVLIFASTSWAQINYSEIDVYSDDFKEFEVFEDSLDQYTVYFTGENHNYASFNTRLEFKLLSYLYETQGVRHFIFEQSPGVGYIIEEIIINDKKSNMHFLKDVFYDPFYYLVKQINKFNDTLALEDKIHIHGIDVERFPYFSIYALDQIVDTLDKHIFGGEVFEQIQALRSSKFEYGTAADFYGDEDEIGFGFGQISAWGTLSSIIQSSHDYRDSLKIALGDKEEIYYAIIASLEKGREWYLSEKKGDVKSPIVRERYMKDEFERIYKKYPNDKFYGQFGRCHLHKDKSARRCYDYYMNSVASRINEVDPSLKNKVLVIPIYYSQGDEKFDRDIIKSLGFDEEIHEKDKAFLIDLAYKEGDHPIVGFYDHLPFVIISNKEADEGDGQFDFSWNTTIQEFHLGAYYGYHYMTGIKTLNNELLSAGANGFTNKWVGWDFTFDMFTVGDFGTRFGFTYFPEISNGDRFDIKAWTVKMGSYFAYGNKWLLASFGLDYGYGQVSLTEDLDNTVPNLIQSPEVGNVIIYRNDRFVFDPNIELRLTLPIISFNFKAGYDLDISGKRWRLDGKMKNFAKTSFSAPYIQAGVSINYKYIH
ncbi:MAG: hypothetical protein HUJ25_13335 [Crocinitomicaceae bacterium]|nr:hypothetical protein [Crocinitomicaceae bacterium]